MISRVPPASRISAPGSPSRERRAYARPSHLPPPRLSSRSTMSDAAPVEPAPVLRYEAQRADVSSAALMRLLVTLSLPVFAEHLLHVFVGWTDTYLANHLVSTKGLTGEALADARGINAAATAAVGTISYVGRFVGLLVGAIGTGSTAIIARAVGGRH